MHLILRAAGVNISTSCSGRDLGIVQQNRRFWEKFLIFAGAKLFPQAWNKMLRLSNNDNRLVFFILDLTFFHILKLSQLINCFITFLRGRARELVQKRPQILDIIYRCSLEKITKVSGFQKVVQEQFPLLNRYIYPCFEVYKFFFYEVQTSIW